MFLPELCPLCKTVIVPTMDGNRLYFKFPEDSNPLGPYNVCESCMEEVRNKLDGASPGRFDILYDGTKRIVFSIDRKIPFTREQVEEIISLMASRSHHRGVYSAEVLPELKKKANQWLQNYYKPIVSGLRRARIECTLAVSHTACNEEPASQDEKTTQAPSPTCTSDFLQ